MSEVKTKLAYRLDHGDLVQLLLGGEVHVAGPDCGLLLSVDGVPVRDSRNLGSFQLANQTGYRGGCIREKTFDTEDDGT